MQIDLTQPLKSLKGEDLTDEAKEPMTLKRVIETALLGQLRGDEGQDQDAKYKLYKLAQRVERDTVAAFSAKETTTILDRVSKAWPALVFGQVKDLLDPPVEDMPVAKPNGVDRADAVNTYHQ